MGLLSFSQFRYSQHAWNLFNTPGWENPSGLQGFLRNRQPKKKANRCIRNCGKACFLANDCRSNPVSSLVATIPHSKRESVDANVLYKQFRSNKNQKNEKTTVIGNSHNSTAENSRILTKCPSWYPRKHHSHQLQTHIAVGDWSAHNVARYYPKNWKLQAIR